MTDGIEGFVIAQNIRHFKTLLQTETHPDKRNILFQLLASDLAKLPESEKRAALGAAGLRNPC